MISYEQAYKSVIGASRDFGDELVEIEKCVGRVLAENILADRDFPPFDRATKDGIAFQFETLKHTKSLIIEDVAAAGEAKKSLIASDACIEVMTGAVLPENTDTVVMYEDLNIQNGIAKLNSIPSKGQNIHKKGSDQKENAVLISSNRKISSASIGILATMGKTMVLVKKLPTIAIISTGNELVGIDEKPEPYQIRTSNSLTLKSLLQNEGINAETFHIKDDKEQIASKLKEILLTFEVVMMSGGVSMGKFDFLPDVLEQLGVKKIFHRVAQRPGKPFWFGHHIDHKTTVFSFPGNPNSTFVNYQLYFKDWLKSCYGMSNKGETVICNESFHGLESLHYFPLVKTKIKKGQIIAERIKSNGSGDMISLLKADGILSVPKNQLIKKGDVVKFIRF